MATTQVLNSPELLNIIFSHTKDSRPTLAAAARVNTTWCEEALNTLWGNRDFGQNPPIHEGHLLTTFPDQRRQYYASKIRMLHIEHNADAVHTALRHLRFSRLQHLLLNRHFASGPVEVLPSEYLQQSLEGVEWFSWDAPLTAEFLTQVNEKCPRLKELTLGEPDTLAISPAQFLDFLKENKSIVELTIAIPDLVDEDLMLYLSSRPGLESLALWDRLWDETIFQNIQNQQSHPFKDLNDITLSLTAPAIPFVVSVLKTITRINLEIEGDGSAAPACLAQLPLLKDFCIRFCDATDLPTQGLLAMKSLTALKRFVFMGHALTSAFNDSQLEDLVSALPGLETFDFPVKCRLSFAALRALSRWCKELAAVTLKGELDLQCLAGCEEPLFPELVTLVIKGDGSGEMPPIHMPAAEIARLLCCHAPKLDDLELTDPRLEDVVEAYES